MRNQSNMKFCLSISRREELHNKLLELQDQLNRIENHLAIKNTQALTLKNKIGEFEKKIAKALIKKSKLEVLAQEPKGLSPKQQQSLENCKKTIAGQEVVLRRTKTYNEWIEVERGYRLNMELIKFNQQKILAELNQLPRPRTPYVLSPSVKEQLNTVINDAFKNTSNSSTRPARAA